MWLILEYNEMMPSGLSIKLARQQGERKTHWASAEKAVGAQQASSYSAMCLQHKETKIFCQESLSISEELHAISIHFFFLISLATNKIHRDELNFLYLCTMDWLTFRVLVFILIVH